MSKEITALLIGGTNYGAVIKLYNDLSEIEIPQRQKLQLAVPAHAASSIAQKSPPDKYQRLTIDKNNRSIYVIKQRNNQRYLRRLHV